MSYSQLLKRLPNSIKKRRNNAHNSLDNSLSSSSRSTSSSSSSLNPKPPSSFSTFNIPSWCTFNVVSRPWLRLKFFCSSISVMASSASHADLAVSIHLPTSIKKKIVGKQKKQELEKEVATHSKMLDQEEKVHNILQQVHQKQLHDNSALHIPDYLPSKMKELLAELVMVEDEISRLESQISALQTELNHEKEVSNELTFTQYGQEDEIPNSPYIPSSTLLTDIKSKGYNGKLSFDTKALHFISNAIKGNNNLRDFSIQDKVRSPTPYYVHKENNEEIEVGHEEKVVPRKPGILKPPSPLRDERHQTPKKERNVEFSIDLPKPQPSLIQLEEESINKWSANKLSENIMKCMIFIYVRLLRTSRGMEIERSGSISRSSSFSLSFRAEPSLNLKANLMLQKELRQQDPYGIFDIEESIPRDIGSYKNLVRFTSSCLEQKCISNSNYLPLLQKLRTYMNGLQKVDLTSLTSQQKLAFWINMYNACIMHGFLQYGVPSSPEKLLVLMNKATMKIGGIAISAHAIEHFILRKQRSANRKERERDNNETMIRSQYGLEPMEPNITFSLCCGTRSSPAVKIYTGDGVVGEMEKAKLEYLQASIVVKNTKRVAIPELLIRNMDDFGKDMESLAKWVCHQLPTSGSLRKSMVDCFKGVKNGKISTTVEKIPYEFDFQYLLSM